MALIKISQFPRIVQTDVDAANDIFAIVDTSLGQNYKITLDDVGSSITASHAISSSFSVSSSYSLTSSFSQTSSYIAGDIITNFNIFTGSINTFTSSINGFTGSINTFTSSINIFTGSINTFTSSVNGFTGSINTFTSSINIFTGSINTFTSSINNFTGSINDHTGSINNFTGSILKNLVYETGSSNLEIQPSSGSNSVSASCYSVINGGQNNEILSSSIQSTIGGGINHYMSGSCLSVIAGGQNNCIFNSPTSYIGGGKQNYICDANQSALIGTNQSTAIKTGSFNTIVGSCKSTMFTEGSQNVILTSQASQIRGTEARVSNNSIIGGTSIEINENCNSIVVGGVNNKINSPNKVGHDNYIIGGCENSIEEFFDGDSGLYFSNNNFIAGGRYNLNCAKDYNYIIAGTYNTASAEEGALILGGIGNIVDGVNRYNTILGGCYNTNSGGKGTIVNGEYNKLTGLAGFIGGGCHNTGSSNSFGAIVTGCRVFIEGVGSYGYVGTGTCLTITSTKLRSDASAPISSDTPPRYDTILNGCLNQHSGSLNSTILNGVSNFTSNVSGAFIGGGQENCIQGLRESCVTINSHIIGGNKNEIYNAEYASINTGDENTISESKHSTIGSGYQSCIKESSYSIVGSGYRNFINSGSDYSAILSGQSNIITASIYSSVIGGKNNCIDSSSCTTVIGGASTRLIESPDSFVFGAVASRFESSSCTVAISNLKTQIMNSTSSMMIYGNGGLICDSNMSSLVSSDGSRILLSDYSSVIGGFDGHIENSKYSHIKGCCNEITGSGVGAKVDPGFNSIQGGYRNCIKQGHNVVILNGIANDACAGDDAQDNYQNSIINGSFNLITGSVHGFIGGGSANKLRGDLGQINRSSILGGQSNEIISSDCSVVLGGQSNCITGHGKSGDNFIAVGSYNCISGSTEVSQVSCHSAIIQGQHNTSSAKMTFIGNGYTNSNKGDNSTILNGCFNSITKSNLRSPVFGNIINGECNTLDDTCYTTIINGCNNKAQNSSFTTIVGGIENTSSCQQNFIGGGYKNFTGGGEVGQNFIGGGTAHCVDNADASSIVGGQCNSIIGSPYNFVGGGNLNHISGSSNNSAILGGKSNIIHNAVCSAILGGSGNCVTHECSAAMGHNLCSCADKTFHINCLHIKELPTSAGGLATGTVYNDSGTLKIVT